MKKRLSFIFCCFSLSLSAMAGPLTPTEALQRYKADVDAPTRSMTVGATDLVYTERGEEGEASMYVFDSRNGGGYIILSADDIAAPLLGYSESGNFDMDNIPPQMKWWMEEYTRQIAYARGNNAVAYSTRSEEERQSVAPLMKTLWNQTAPYNDLTPLVNGKHAPTGCVATAMAQVMKYWDYPRQATGTSTIILPSTGSTDTFSLGRESLAWNSMLDSYSGSYSDEEAHAVAYLMKVAGYSCKMQYGADASSAFSYRAGLALIDNFSYNPNLQYCTRDYFSASEWEDLIYNEIAAGRPVLYGGQSTSVGHEFVCDGYAGNGFFHFNWGWSGMSDGYFLLNSLNPDALGTGGGLGGGFNFGQDALVGVQPESTEVPPYIVQFGALNAVAFRSDVTIRLRSEDGGSSWVNTGLSELNVSIGVAFEKIGSTDSPTYVSVSNVKVGKPELEDVDGALGMNFYGIRGEMTVTVPNSIKEGDYKVTVVVKHADGSDWTPVLTLPQYSNYFYLNKSGSKITVETVGEASVTLDKAEILSALYYDSLAKLRVEATNDSDKDITAGFYPKLYSGGAEKMEGDGIVINVPAHTSVTEEFYTTFRITDGSAVPTSPSTYQLVWYDPMIDDNYTLAATEVTMNVAPPTPQLAIDNFGIKGVEPQITNVEGIGNLSLSTVAGREEADFRFDVTSNDGFFGYPLTVAIFAMGNNRAVMSAGCSPLVISKAGESATTQASADLSSLKKSTVYVALVFYSGPSGMVQVQSCNPLYFCVEESAGVDEISSGNSEPVKYYNMQGTEITQPMKGMLLIRKQGGHTEKIIF